MILRTIRFGINEPNIIKIIEMANNTGNIIPTFSLYLQYILLNKIFDINLIIREILSIPPIIKAVVSTSKSNSNFLKFITLYNEKVSTC